MSDSMDKLVETVARNVFEKARELRDAEETWESLEEDWRDAFRLNAKVAIRAVLAHFSEPGNVSEWMCIAADPDERSFVTSKKTAAAMRAALEEMK